MILQKGTATLEKSLVVSYSIKHAITTQSAILLPCIYPNELKIYVHIKTCTSIFIRAILLIVHTWKQLKCPSVGEKTAVQPDNWILFSDKKWAIKSWKDIK